MHAPERSSPFTDDMGFKDKDVKGARAILREQEVRSDHVDYEFKIWKGKPFPSGNENTSHSLWQCVGTASGFAVRPNLKVPDVKAGYEGALDQTIAWFKKTL